MSRKNVLKSAPPEKLEELERLRYQVKRFEDKGLMDTAAHEALKRLEAELGLITSGKTEGPKEDEVNNGESDL